MEDRAQNDQALIARARLAAGRSWDGKGGGHGNEVEPQEQEVRRILRECAARLAVLTKDVVHPDRLTDSTSESRIINEVHGQLFERFKAECCAVDSVVTVVLFKSPGDHQRTYHIAQAMGQDVKESPEELFCESAARMGTEARKVAINYSSRRRKP